MNKITESYNFTAFGRAIKRARKDQNMTREHLAEILDLAPRHIQALENQGQCPSFPLFVRLITMFNISVDQYLFPYNPTIKTSLRRQLDATLDTFDDKDLAIVNGTATAIYKAKETEV